ncbi:MAG TPA: sensor histidine kinase [Bryobacteraceae bacterium]|jgi:signal transduction histidine kinase|nr:sensor histidine kinase [Bryobacteraceae bacterium]
MQKSPTMRLLFGLFVTLAAVTTFSGYQLRQLSYLRDLQTKKIDLNRHDSLLLLRIQNDVNTLGLKLQEMTESRPPVTIKQFQSEFERLRGDLSKAVRADAQLMPQTRRAERQAELEASLQNFWMLCDRVFDEAAQGREQTAREIAAKQLTDHQIVLARRLSGLLEDNNEMEARADGIVAAVYTGAERQTYLFLAATIATILITSLYMIQSNRRIFDRLEALSKQRRVLAARLISVQEEVLRSISRELHDEFGQILTAVGAMLGRAERKGIPPDSPFRTELQEVREITQNTLEKMRSLSQMLHPAILDDYGLVKGIEWYGGVFHRQTGIETLVRIEGEVVPITGTTATHCFRIVQEALTNAAKHSQTKSAEVQMVFGRNSLAIHIRDFGTGMTRQRKGFKPGLGVIAMRERTELISGKLDITSTPGSGTTVSLSIPLRQDEVALEMDISDEIGEAVTP